jgi:hypothetical protein
MGRRLAVANALLGLAACDSAVGDNYRASVLYGSAAAYLDRLGEVAHSSLGRMLEDDQRRLRQIMGEGNFDGAYQTGISLSSADAFALALEDRTADFD